LQSQARHIEDEQSSTVPLRGLGRTPLRVSMLGFGSSPLGNVFQQTDPAEADATVSLALGRGINFFDVSPFYGGTLAEQRLGEALKGHFAEHRDKIVLATKCGRYGAETFDFSAARTFASIDESLIRLNTSYVDLLQVHDVEFGDIEQIIHETIPALRIIQQSGKARYIGITGYSLPPLIKIAEQAPVDTILTYCRHNLMVTDMDEVLVPFARQHGVGLINASALHMGLLTDHTVPAWHPAPPEVIEAGKRIMELCRDRGYDGTQVALRFCFDQPDVASTLVGMATRRQVQAALATLRMQADPELLREIREIVAPVFNYIWPSGRLENHG
jgi:L-galactose dehydrogenase